MSIAAVVVAGCIGGETVNPPTASPAAPSAAPSASTSPSASAAVSSAPPATASPTASPTPSSTPSEASSASAATADVCTGTDENREFFANAAARFPWPVYCAVLPARWNVVQGSFGGGRLDIAYRGPNGATLALYQGDGCGDDAACQRTGTEVGAAAFGDQTGTLAQLDDGGWGITVDDGANPSWVAIGDGMDEQTFRALAADLARLD
jgi:hypothetical protein